MLVPTFEASEVVQLDGESKGYWTDIYHNLFVSLLQEMQRTIGNNGFVIPPVSSAPGSVMPPASGGQRQQIQNTFGQQGGVTVGTMVFDPSIVNGGSSGTPNGQLFVLLGDGTFHAIPNS